MRVIKYLFYLLRGCSSSSKPWLELCWSSHLSQPSINKISGKEQDNGVNAVPWDKLPVDILKLIFERLDLKDRIRFDLVCKQWRTNTTVNPQLLWLMFPYDENYRCLSFFDMSEGKVHDLNLPKSAQGGWFCGCSKGWLFLAKGTKNNLQIFLFDPISRVQIPLPPLSTISSFENSFLPQRSKWNPGACIISQVVVSSSDASQCIVAAIFLDDDGFLALCRPQDERWTIVEGLLPDGYTFADILFSDGKLYVCFFTNLDGDEGNNVGDFRTHSIILGGHDMDLKLIPFIYPAVLNPFIYAADADGMIWYLKDGSVKPHLVESNGQVLMVTSISDSIRTLDFENLNIEEEDDQVLNLNNEEEEEDEEENDEVLNLNNEEEDDEVLNLNNDEEEEDDHLLAVSQIIDNDNLLLNYYQIDRFEVLKIQTTDTMCITRLSSLGNQSLFVGGGVSVAGNFSEFDKNCIYFVEDRDYSFTQEYPPASREAGVFYLDDGSIKRSFPSTKTDNGCYMNWFSPNIKIGAFN